MTGILIAPREVAELVSRSNIVTSNPALFLPECERHFLGYPSLQQLLRTVQTVQGKNTASVDRLNKPPEHLSEMCVSLGCSQACVALAFAREENRIE